MKNKKQQIIIVAITIGLLLLATLGFILYMALRGQSGTSDTSEDTSSYLPYFGTLPIWLIPILLARKRDKINTPSQKRFLVVLTIILSVTMVAGAVVFLITMIR